FPTGGSVAPSRTEGATLPPGEASPMLKKVKALFSTAGRDAQTRERLEQLRERVPVPVFWLFGKTQSGKTSIIKYLTGAESAAIGDGLPPSPPLSRPNP